MSIAESYSVHWSCEKLCFAHKSVYSAWIFFFPLQIDIDLMFSSIDL